MRIKLKMLLLCGLLSSFACVAVEPKTGSGDGGAAIKKAQGLIRQLSQEKTALETEKAALLQEKSTLSAKLHALESELQRYRPLPAELERYKSAMLEQKSAYQQQIGQENQLRQTLQDKHNQVVTKANALLADNQLLVRAVQEREQWIGQCSERNQQLQSLNREVVGQYREKGLLQQLSELDALTGIGDVAGETVAEDYRYRLQQLRITPFKAVEVKTLPVPAAGLDESKP